MLTSGITSELGVQGLLSVLHMIMGQETVSAGVNQAIASAIMPPGSEGASLGATGTQDVNSTQWTAMFMEGMMEMERMLMTIQADGGSVMMQDVTSAATF